ncbi:hypothetical protein IP84_04235 [beta proteobacterium AAP99]|nr:hypothetical protein IP84_04235 [beta proteobacterium AAP99]
MYVRVRCLRSKGAVVPMEIVKTLPAVEGRLTVREERDPELGRPVTRARLLERHAGNPVDILPDLSDATLLWAEDGALRLSGIERVGKVAYAQTWAVELT